MRGVRVVIGAPLYQQAAFLGPALESLQAQTYEPFAVVLVDDCSNDETVEVAERVTRDDPRFALLRNAVRVGMAANWRRCVEVARLHHPEAEFFAWGSDHDWWHPEWLERLVEALDASPDAVLAYPQSVRIDERGEIVRGPFTIDTAGLSTPDARVRRACTQLPAGSVVYGLFRLPALERAGTFRSVLVADRLLLTELAIQGPFVQVPRVLWHRRFVGLATRARQRRSLFAARPPWHAYLPPWLVHAAVLAWVYVVVGVGKPALSRRAAVRVVAVFVSATVGRQRERARRSRDEQRRRRSKQRKRRKKQRRRALRRLLRRAQSRSGRWLRALVTRALRRPG